MKITVGHVLIIAGVGVYVALGPLKLHKKVNVKMPDVYRLHELAYERIPYLSKIGLKRPATRGGEKFGPTVATRGQPPGSDFARSPEDRLPAGENPPAVKETFSEVPLTPVPPKAAEVVPAPMNEPGVKGAAATATPTPKIAARRTRRTASRAAQATAATKTARTVAPKPAAAKKAAAADKLVGSYVALTLKTGNVVKGILLEKTATNYKIELPGMGGFDYPATTVKSVAAAE